jgi:predicted DNA-binding transcriptional regulator AlpA
MEKMEKLMNETEVSEFLGMSLACGRRWRLFGEGPEYRKVGLLVRYRPEAVNEWLNNQQLGGNGHRFEPRRRENGTRHAMAHVRRSPGRVKAQALVERTSAA